MITNESNGKQSAEIKTRWIPCQFHQMFAEQYFLVKGRKPDRKSHRHSRHFRLSAHYFESIHRQFS